MRSLLGVLLVAAAGLHWGGTSAATAAAGAAAIAGATALQDSPRGRIPLVVGVSAVDGCRGAAGVDVLVVRRRVHRGRGAVVLRSGNGVGRQRQRRADRRGGERTAGDAAADGAVLVRRRDRHRARRRRRPGPGGCSSRSGRGAAGGFSATAWRARTASLAADARSLADDPTGHVDPEPLLWLREAFTLTDAQARRRPLAYRAWYGLPERISVT